MKYKVKELTEEGEEKELEEVKSAMDKVLEDGLQSIKQEKKDLERLYDHAKSLISEFENSKYSWNQLDSLLSRIEKNSVTIE